MSILHWSLSLSFASYNGKSSSSFFGKKPNGWYYVWLRVWEMRWNNQTHTTQLQVASNHSHTNKNTNDRWYSKWEHAAFNSQESLEFACRNSICCVHTTVPHCHHTITSIRVLIWKELLELVLREGKDWGRAIEIALGKMQGEIPILCNLENVSMVHMRTIIFWTPCFGWSSYNYIV